MLPDVAGSLALIVILDNLKAAKIPPGGRLRRGFGQSAWDYPQAQSAWDYPQGSRLFAHATDTDDAVTPPTAVSDCQGARVAKKKPLLSPKVTNNREVTNNRDICLPPPPSFFIF